MSMSEKPAQFAGDREGPRMDDRLRRRNRTDSPPRMERADGDAENGSHERRGSFGGMPGLESPVVAEPMRPPLMSQPAKPAPAKESFFDKLKRTASQPALASGPRLNFSDAAQSIVGDGLR